MLKKVLSASAGSVSRRNHKSGHYLRRLQYSLGSAALSTASASSVSIGTPHISGQFSGGANFGTVRDSAATSISLPTSKGCDTTERIRPSTSLRPIRAAATPRRIPSGAATTRCTHPQLSRRGRVAIHANGRTTSCERGWRAVLVMACCLQALKRLRATFFVIWIDCEARLIEFRGNRRIGPASIEDQKFIWIAIVLVGRNAETLLTVRGRAQPVDLAGQRQVNVEYDAAQRLALDEVVQEADRMGRRNSCWSAHCRHRRRSGFSGSAAGRGKSQSRCACRSRCGPPYPTGKIDRSERWFRRADSGKSSAACRR